MTRRHLAPLERPEPTSAEQLSVTLDRFEHLAAERLDVAVHLAHARHVAANVTTVEVGANPTVAQVYAWRELRLAVADLARLVAPVEVLPDPGDDPELERLVDAIRSMG